MSPRDDPNRQGLLMTHTSSSPYATNTSRKSYNAGGQIRSLYSPIGRPWMYGPSPVPRPFTASKPTYNGGFFDPLYRGSARQL